MNHKGDGVWRDRIESYMLSVCFKKFLHLKFKNLVIDPVLSILIKKLSITNNVFEFQRVFRPYFFSSKVQIFPKSKSYFLFLGVH